MIIGLFENDFPFLKFLLYIFNKKFKEALPQIHANFTQQQLQDELWIWKWFLTQYLYSFPYEVVVRIWDYVISSNIFSCVSIALAILQYYERQLKDMELTQIVLFLQDFRSNEKVILDKTSEYHLDINRLFSLAKSFGISKDYVNNCAKEYLKKFPDVNIIYLNYYKDFLKHNQQSASNFREQMKIKCSLSNPNNLNLAINNLELSRATEKAYASPDNDPNDKLVQEQKSDQHIIKLKQVNIDSQLNQQINESQDNPTSQQNHQQIKNETQIDPSSTNLQNQQSVIQDQASQFKK
eukprot:TRINITY_DN386_c0_g1_i6.p1 TRINITY_DN386_c0_g1~~TRINITY_DN386_c0_g1_i6.p1  ORF type:complete len:295 (-),score=36.88 TRINITY_DN386_c0_g1_i6:8-892(-)